MDGRARAEASAFTTCRHAVPWALGSKRARSRPWRTFQVQRKPSRFLGSCQRRVPKSLGRTAARCHGRQKINTAPVTTGRRPQQVWRRCHAATAGRRAGKGTAHAVIDISVCCRWRCSSRWRPSWVPAKPRWRRRSLNSRSPHAFSSPKGITSGPDGALWFTEN